MTLDEWIAGLPAAEDDRERRRRRSIRNAVASVEATQRRTLSLPAKAWPVLAERLLTMTAATAAEMKRGRYDPADGLSGRRRRAPKRGTR